MLKQLHHLPCPSFSPTRSPGHPTSSCPMPLVILTSSFPLNCKFSRVYLARQDHPQLGDRVRRVKMELSVGRKKKAGNQRTWTSSLLSGILYTPWRFTLRCQILGFIAVSGKRRDGWQLSHWALFRVSSTPPLGLPLGFYCSCCVIEGWKLLIWATYSNSRLWVPTNLLLRCLCHGLSHWH